MKVEKAIFAAGCFWGVQHQFERIPGVLNTTVGYTGGPEANPTYTQVKAHMTHHVEAIFVDYDADMVSYVDLCKLFFTPGNCRRYGNGGNGRPTRCLRLSTRRWSGRRR